MESDHTVAAVFTQPDRTGRGHHRHVNAVKSLAIGHGVPVHQPHNVNHAAVLDTLRDLNADAFVVAAYGQILKQDFLDIPRLGAFNLHGSLLPRHRGAAPVQYSIWKGDRLTGITVFRIERGLDSGPIVGKVETEIDPTETSADLMPRLAELSVSLTDEVLRQLELGTATFQCQDAAGVTLAPKLRKEDGQIDWTQSPRQIDCQVRAMQPWPKANSRFVRSDGTSLRCIILDVAACDTVAPAELMGCRPGDLVSVDKRLVVCTGDGAVELKIIQPQGKKPMTADSFLNGYGATKECRFAREEDINAP